MADSSKVEGILFDLIDKLNGEVPADEKIDKALDTVIFGEGSQLDSLGLVNLVVSAEKRVEKDLGKLITLADERAITMDESPFRTIRTLRDYICLLIDESE